MSGKLNLWLLLLALVCGLSFWFGRGGGREVVEGMMSVPGSASEPPQPVWVNDEEPVHLLVLNGTGTSNLANDFRILMSRAGMVVEDVGNAPNEDFSHSILVNRRLDRNRAEQLALMLGGLVTVREWDERSTEDAVLVLGSDHADLRRHLLEEIVRKQAE